MGQYDNDNYVIEVKLRDNVSDDRWEPLYKKSPSIREYKEYYKKTIVNSFNPTAERLIRFFMEYDNGVLYPDKFNFCEPVNKPFNESCIAQAVSYLANPAGCVYLKKSRFADIDIENKTFSFGWIDGVYSEPLVPLPNYLTIITVYFPKKKNTDLGFIIQLMKDIKSYFDADNGKVFYQATKEIIAEE